MTPATTTAGGGTGERGAPDAGLLIGALLRAVRRGLGMDVAFVGQVLDGERLVRHVDVADGVAGVAAGTRHPLAETLCARIVDGTAPALLADVAAEAHLASLPAVAAMGVRAHVGVPIVLADGSLFGTLCAYSRQARHDLDARTVAGLRAVADVVAEWIDAAATAESPMAVARDRILEVLRGEQPMDIVFQPIVDVRTGTVAGAEALARFPGGSDGPEAWFADAGRAGLGVRLELQAAGAAIARLGELPPNTYLSVNLSPTALEGAIDAGVFDVAEPERIVIELTEHVAVDDYDRLVVEVAQLRQTGIRFAVDDAGTGYSSLSHVLRLRPDFIKLDRALIQGLHEDPARRSLAAALSQFADQIEAVVIAEGVEEEAELETVLTCGVRFVQGFLLSRPGPPPLTVAPVATAGPKPSVVVVDDDRFVRQLLVHQLTRSGFHVAAQAADGIEGIVAAAAHQPDIVLLDLHMPRLDGRDALPRIRQVAPSCLVVMVTASDPGAIDTWDDRPDAVLEKTDGVQVVADQVRRLLARAPRPQHV